MSKPPTRPTPEALARYATEFNQSAPLRAFGVEVSFPSPDRVRLDLPVRAEHLGGLGTDAVNGGILAALFDLAIGCTPALLNPTRRTATMQLSMSFQKPTRGERIWVDAWMESWGNTTLFAAAEVHDGQGQVTARCTGVVKLSHQTWASGSSPAIS